MGKFLRKEIAFSVNHSEDPTKIKEKITEAVNKRLPDTIKHHWDNNHLYLEGLGAEGYVEILENVINVKVKLQLPLSMMRDKIEQNLREVIDLAIHASAED